MGNPTLNKNYTAEAEVKKHRIVKFGAADGQVIYADSATAKSIGVSMELDSDAGDRVDVTRTGMPAVEYGGTVAAGDLLTSDAEGRAVVAAPSTGGNMRIIGIAEHAGSVGDIGCMALGFGSMQG
jgi:hypothetical protein